MSTDAVVKPAASTAQWRQQMRDKAAVGGPSFLRLQAQLPLQGRTNIVLGATALMSVVLKTYASGGENELHAHPHEDHLFVVLQGSANFQGPQGEARVVGRNECVLLPRGTLYRFHVTGSEPLVMLRVGSVADPADDPLARVDPEGRPFDGYSGANHEVLPVLGEHWFG